MLKLVPAIHRAKHRIGLFLADLTDEGLSQGESHILARLWQTEQATIAELHADLAHRRSTLTSILDRLVGRGYVTREPSVDDRRTFVVALTPKGAAVARHLDARVRALERIVAAQVSSEDLRRCVKVLMALEEAAKRSAGRAAR